jgi:hypothetical protein
MNQTARELPSHALCLSALIILKTRNVIAFAFRCFTELLSQPALGPEAIELAEEVSERLNSTQLSQMNAALGTCPREGGDRLDGLRLKEAYALLREGEVDAAICLVKTLRISPRLNIGVQRFYDEAALSSGKVDILEQRLSAKLEEISRDSPSVAETLSVIHQLLNALHSRKPEVTSQSLISLKTEVLNETLAKLEQQTSHSLALDAHIQRLEEQAQRKEADCHETLSSLRAKVEALTEELVRAGKAASQTQTAQEAAFKSIEERSQKSETVAQQTISSLRIKVEVLTGAHLKVEEEVKSVKTVLNIQIQSLDKKFNKAKAATQQILNDLRAAVETLRVDLDQAWSQCKQCQVAMLQATSEKTPAELAHTIGSYRSPPKTTKATKQPRPRKPQHTPTFFYCFKYVGNMLDRVKLLTGKQSMHEVPHYQFKDGCRWSEGPGGSLLITGGMEHYDVVRDVVRLDVGTFTVSPQPPMQTPRSDHAAVYHSQYVYVLGGRSDRFLSECERYSWAESRWEVLPDLPVPGSRMSGVELENRVYALGGYGRDTVQKLSLDSLTWQLMQLKLPQAADDFPCFKKDTEVYLVIARTLYSFTPLHIKAVKNLDEDIRCSSSCYLGKRVTTAEALSTTSMVMLSLATSFN